MGKEREIERVFDILDKHITLEHKAFADNIIGEWDAAKAIVEAGYCKIIPNVDFVVRCSDLVNIREKAYNDARNETAKEIFDDIQKLYSDAENMTGYELFKCGVLDALNNVLDMFHQKFGLEVDE